MTTNHLTPAQIESGGMLLGGAGFGYQMAVTVEPDEHGRAWAVRLVRRLRHGLVQRPARRADRHRADPGQRLPVQRRADRLHEGGVPVMTSLDAVTAWIGNYQAAWTSNDPEQIAGLFAEDAAYFPEPFATPWRGRAEIVEKWLARKDDAGHLDLRVAPADRHRGPGHHRGRDGLRRGPLQQPLGAAPGQSGPGPPVHRVVDGPVQEKLSGRLQMRQQCPKSLTTQFAM